MKKPLIFLFSICVFSFTSSSQTTGQGSRLKEIFQLTNLQTGLNDPWEITYGPDGYLWVTESKGYKVYRVNPSSGTKTTALDISQNSTFLPLADRTFNLQFNFSGQGNPQGGLAGLALHPDFMSATTTPKNYVYISYIHKYVTTVGGNGGVFFTNQLVRFYYDTLTGLLGSPVSLCDTLPGSSDHNSQRMIIAPVNGTNYLFYAQGDMGAGQFSNSNRANHAQESNHYEGKILRFNLESDGDAGLDAWIPDDNPFNTTSPAHESAVWATGIRNNQGFAYAKINGVDYLYGSSHGPFSDDEVNIIERGKNYGHPNVIGFSSDHNYDNAKAGGSSSSLPLISNEATYASTTIGSSYGDPIYCFYAAPKGNTSTSGTIQYIYNQFNSGNQDNSAWPSESPSGLDIYTNSMIPGWKNSLLLACLKGGKIMRLKLNNDGATVVSPGAGPVYNDTISYYRSQNRFRDIAISPDGKTIFTLIDKSSSTSGPSSGNPIISACAGCLQKYTFLGYSAQSAGNLYRSTIPTSISIAAGKIGLCENVNKVVINSANNNDDLWVPITDTSGNVVAEINANNHNLDTISVSVYTTSSIRIQNSKKYLGRNITITPQTQPGGTVRIRLYISKAEFDALQASSGSGISTISDLKILKNSDVCGSGIASNTTLVNPTVAEAFGGNAYVLQGNITGFSSFYFGSALITLPAELVNFKGTLQNNNSVLLEWQTASENNTKQFVIEKSTDGSSFNSIGSVAAAGNSTTLINYNYTDNNAVNPSSNLLYYRLRIEDNDGKYKYSDIITVSLSYVAGRVNISPNPSSGTANVNVGAPVDGKAIWKIIDNIGQVVLQNSVELRTGNNNFPINISGLAAGSYYLSVSGAGVDQKVKLSKL
jgi:trimeric autotransporter adhesin